MKKFTTLHNNDLGIELSKLRTGHDTEPLLINSGLGSGLVEFSEAAFPDTSISQISAQFVKREPTGSGAHFDVYQPYLDEQFPWIAVYNFTGKALLRGTFLPKELHEDYNRSFSEANALAHEARRDYAAIALASNVNDSYETTVVPGMGFVVPQLPAEVAEASIHHIIPTEDEPSFFVKLAIFNTEIANPAGFVKFSNVISRVIEDACASGSHHLEDTRPRKEIEGINERSDEQHDSFHDFENYPDEDAVLD